MPEKRWESMLTIIGDNLDTVILPDAHTSVLKI